MVKQLDWLEFRLDGNLDICFFACFQPRPTEMGSDIQGVNLMAFRFKNKELPGMQRRVAIRLAVGGAMGLVLAACGGGGDGSSGSVQALRDAFAKLYSGMTVADVEAMVGFPANHWRYETYLSWIVDGVELYVGFYSNDPKTIVTATLTEADRVNNQVRRFE